MCFVFFFFKQKTAYEMRISDWSSDVCSSDLRVDWVHWIESAKQAATRSKRVASARDQLAKGKKRVCCFDSSGFYDKSLAAPDAAEIGRASCRERVCQYV